MVAISATNSATPSLQMAMVRNKLTQAKREADQAEDKAQNLRNQADAAEVEAQNGKDRVRDLSARRVPSDLTYSNPSRSENPLNSNLVQNSQGQTTGRFVNVRA
jgi:hypothetical protein